MEHDFRALNPRERGLLEKLLEYDFPGRDDLRKQMDSARARQIYDDGTLALQVESGPRAEVKYTVPTEGMCPDADGVMIHLLLHVANGIMDELEIVKEDASPIARPPTADALVVVRPGGWPR